MEKRGNRIELPGQGHADIVLESVNAIDEANDWRVLRNGQSLGIAQWSDLDDVRHYLTARPEIDPKTRQMPEHKRKYWTRFHLKRQSSMPDFADQQYAFSTRSHEDRVWLCDDAGKTIHGASHEQNIGYMNIIIKALRERPTRQDTDTSMRLFALDRIMSAESVKQLVRRIDDGTNNSVSREFVMSFILQNEPLLVNDRELIESCITDLQMYKAIEGPTPDPV